MHYLEGLNERQKEAALHTEGPLLIVAGAGAGKTKTITHRIAHVIESGVPARSILAVTFTNKAAGEMRERVMKLLEHSSKPLQGRPLVSTFHSLGVRLLREFHAEAGLERNFTIWDRDDSMRAIKGIAEKLAIETPPRSLLSAISRQKGEGVSVAEFGERASNYRERAVLSVWREYDKALAVESALDFDDLLARTLVLLKSRADVLSLLTNRWSYITIDEYQDTNASQYEIARLLAGEKRNICVVGDIDQNIYSWRGADIEHLLNFERAFAGAKVVLLEQNYRSTRTILTAANAIIEKNRRRVPKNLFTDNPIGEAITLFPGRNEIDEAWFIAEMSSRAIGEGTKPGEVAVLYRENFQSRAIEEALLAAGLPYRVLGTRFFDRKEVKDVLSYLRAALNPKNKQDLGRIIAVPPRGIGKVTLDKWMASGPESLAGAARVKVDNFLASMAKIAHAVAVLPVSEAVRFTIEESGIGRMLEAQGDDSSSGIGASGRERLDNVRELVNLATRYDDMVNPEGMEKLLEEAALQSEQDSLPAGVGAAGENAERSAISLMTVHASKGLEFDVVFVTGLEQGLFPSIRESDVARDPEEERRLLYVALTRARKKLFLTYAQERMRWGSREYSLPSEFISDIDDRLLDTPAGKPRKRGILDSYEEDEIR